MPQSPKELAPASESFIDRVYREVPLSVLTDQAVYDLEMERVFARSWLMLAHQSEVPNPGDYVTRDMGDDKVIVSRDARGEIHVLLNVCPHRGMRVCSAERGNGARFQCIFHGWVFRPDGSFVGLPMAEQEMQGDIRAKSELGLKRARVAVYGGFVFATWNLNGPSLDEWLGDYKFYLDTMFLRTDEGLEVLGPPQRMVLNMNWKLAGETFAADAFHTLTLHRSVAEMGALAGGGKTIEEQAVTAFEVDVSANGHGMHLLGAPRPASRELSVMERLRMVPPPGMTSDMVPELEHRLSLGQLKLLADFGGAAGGMFPNVGLLWVYGAGAAPEGMPNGTLIVHTLTPRGPNKHEYLTWFLAEKSTSPEGKTAMLKQALLMFGSSGMIEVDDTDAWLQVQAGAGGHRSRKETLKYHALLGENRPPDWPGGGKVFEGFSKDDTQWEFWKRWDDMMQRP